jgi:outer membrane protein OmpA-like peptidoglycan-associated protein
MLTNQERALVHVYLLNGRQRRLVHTFDARNLRRDNERPAIVATADSSGTEVTITLTVDGELVSTATIAVSAEDLRWSARSLLIPMAIAVVVAGIGVGAWRIVAWRNGFSNTAFADADSGASIAESDVDETAGASEWVEEEAWEQAYGVSDTDGGIPAPVSAAVAEVVTSPAPDSPVDDTSGASEWEEEETSDSAAPLGETSGESARSSQAPVSPIPAVPPAESAPPGTPESTTTTQSSSVRTEPVTQEYVVFFDPESAVLLPVARDELAGIAAEISGGRVTILAAGHTALYDSEASRQSLSEERARAVVDYLRNLLTGKVSGANLDMDVVGYGGTRPVTRDAEDQWRNRRVELAVTVSATR